MSDDRPRLYGLRDAECMWSDPAEVWENDIEPFGSDEGDSWEVEEWTASPAYTSTPNSAKWIKERVVEYVTEDWDEYGTYYVRLMADPVLADLFRQVDAHFAKEITWLMAEGFVGSHLITVVNGQPTWDGEPMHGAAK